MGTTSYQTTWKQRVKNSQYETTGRVGSNLKMKTHQSTFLLSLIMFNIIRSEEKNHS